MTLSHELEEMVDNERMRTEKPLSPKGSCVTLKTLKISQNASLFFSRQHVPT